ncbi:MAG: polysaccharide deacetylase family protein [Saprospiraceae bacterium]|nr:polysaccharide deacetylase family protein [Saprospiraceae bacterium]
MDKYIKFLKREWANWAFHKSVQLPLQEALVSFTFDDAPHSAFTQGGGILEGKGFSGTFYIALSFLDDQLQEEASFSKNDLQLALEKGHELACHTYRHIDLSKTNLLESIKDIKKNGELFKELFPEHELRNFSYPFGAETLAIKKFLGQEFRSARGIGHGLNVGKVDLANLKTIKLYRDRLSLEDIAKQIADAKARKAWVIFYTHDVQENPSPYGCTPAYFEAVVKMCANAKLQVQTVDKALDLIDELSQRSKQN